MYNARLLERRSPGERLEPVGYPKSPAALEANTNALAPLVQVAQTEGRFSYPTPAGSTRSYSAWYGFLDHWRLVDCLEQLEWLPADHFTADLVWLKTLQANQLEDWAVVMPQHAGAGPRSTFLGRTDLSVFRRQRRRDPLFGAISDPKHRVAADRIAGVREIGPNDATVSLYQERRGALLLYPVVETPQEQAVPDALDPGELILACVFVAPTSTGSPDGALVRFVVRDRHRADEAIIDRAVVS